MEELFRLIDITLVIFFGQKQRKSFGILCVFESFIYRKVSEIRDQYYLSALELVLGLFLGVINLIFFGEGIAGPYICQQTFYFYFIFSNFGSLSRFILFISSSFTTRLIPSGFRICFNESLIRKLPKPRPARKGCGF